MTDKQKVMLDAAAEALDSLSFGAPSEPQPQPLPEHTPGPWGRNDHVVYYLNPRIESGEMSELEPDPRHDSIIASTVPVSAAAWSSGINDEEAEANARLIAAAPALLEACRALVGLNGHASLNPMRQAVEAIDLATGANR